MTDKLKILALFEDIDPAAHSMDALHDLGVEHDEIEVISGSPVKPEMFARPHPHSNVPRFAFVGAVFGALVGVFLAFVTPRLYKIYVGGKPLSPGAPSIVVIFEMIMLLMLIFTFLGVFIESFLPSYEEKEYVPEISDGDIAILVDIDAEKQSELETAMKNAGAKMVRIAERQQP